MNLLKWYIFKILLSSIFLLIYYFSLCEQFHWWCSIFQFHHHLFWQFIAILLFTGVKFSLTNKFALGIPIAFFWWTWAFSYFTVLLNNVFILILWAITFFFWFPRWWLTSFLFRVISNLSLSICQWLFLLVVGYWLRNSWSFNIISTTILT